MFWIFSIDKINRYHFEICIAWPKPEIADPGTFTKEGEVVPTTDAGKDGEAQIDLSKPEENGTPDTMVGVDVNAGEQNN